MKANLCKRLWNAKLNAVLWRLIQGPELLLVQVCFRMKNKYLMKGLKFDPHQELCSRAVWCYITGVQGKQALNSITTHSGHMCVCLKRTALQLRTQAILIRDGETKARLPCCLQSNGGGGRQRQRWDESSGRKLLRSISSAPECVVVLRSAGPQPINQTALCPLWFWSTRKINFWSHPHPFLQRRMKSLRCSGWSLRTHVVRPCHDVATQIYSTALMKMKLLAYTFMSIHDWKCGVELFF